MNSGAPIKDVIAPIGKIIGDITIRAIQSLSKSRIAPIYAEAGIRYLLSRPIMVATACGAINPMKLIIPTKETIAATQRALTAIPKSLTVFTLTPKPLAVCVPSLIAL
jgi:hypothetical protein